MSLDTTIAVFQFNDGMCRVGLVQAVENFDGFDWLKSRFPETNRDQQMLGYRRYRSQKTALNAATRIFLRHADNLQHGVELIKLDCPSLPPAKPAAEGDDNVRHTYH
jgi:hypothetical protein